MHVPSDSFNGRSPEKQASLMIERLFTFCACKIVLAQLQGDGRGDVGRYGGGQDQTLRVSRQDCLDRRRVIAHNLDLGAEI